MMTRAIAILTLAFLAAPAARAQEQKLTTYYLVVLLKGKAWTAQESPERTKIQEQHIAHLTKLGDEGVGLAAGPFGDGGDIRGLLIVTAKSEQHARELEAADPAVKAGRLTIRRAAVHGPRRVVPQTGDPLRDGDRVLRVPERRAQPRAGSGDRETPAVRAPGVHGGPAHSRPPDSRRPVRRRREPRRPRGLSRRLRRRGRGIRDRATRW